MAGLAGGAVCADIAEDAATSVHTQTHIAVIRFIRTILKSILQAYRPNIRGMLQRHETGA
jgi:hypothetical protein